MRAFLESELNKYEKTANIDFNKKILQIVPFGYAQDDILLGIKTPILRKIANKYYKQTNEEDIKYFLSSPIHEYRLLASIIITLKENEFPKEMFILYLENINSFNNWDLIDITAPKIIGKYIYKNFTNKEIKSFLNCLYHSDNFWYRRIAIVSTLYLIKKDKLDLCLDFFEKVVDDSHHLNNKALGWMLREIGKKDKEILIDFILENKLKSITFNYATEKLSPLEKASLKEKYLKLFT